MCSQTQELLKEVLNQNIFAKVHNLHNFMTHLDPVAASGSSSN